ncbi:MAG: adenylyltransferase/cytidyltransferase family protein, partial [Blastocatellia bacterium]
GVYASVDELPRELPATNFPADLTTQALTAVHTQINDDDEIPPACAVEELRRRRPHPLVMVSGCFDLIHAGHIRLIEAAAGYGAPPVVAMLTTRAIRRQPKNLHRRRPLWTMADRVTLLEELRSKPRLLLFDGPDCLELIADLQPDVWIKELRDRGRPIVEQEALLVEQLGGRIVWAENQGCGSSSTAIEEQLFAFSPLFPDAESGSMRKQPPLRVKS